MSATQRCRRLLLAASVGAVVAFFLQAAFTDPPRETPQIQPVIFEGETDG